MAKRASMDGRWNIPNLIISDIPISGWRSLEN